jgi:hypothetical protein
MSKSGVAIDKLTQREICDLLASLEVDVDKLLQFRPSIIELKKQYRKMLAHQLREFRDGDTCMLPIWMELK